jgi:hypothetical protein
MRGKQTTYIGSNRTTGILGYLHYGRFVTAGSHYRFRVLVKGFYICFDTGAVPILRSWLVLFGECGHLPLQKIQEAIPAGI